MAASLSPPPPPAIPLHAQRMSNAQQFYRPDATTLFDQVRDDNPFPRGE